jgi:IclR family pca regulon transcriptional regulator
MNEGVKSAMRVLDILELFSNEAEALGVSEVAKRIGIPKSSALALLTTLTTRGYLVRRGVGYTLPAELKPNWLGGMYSRLQSVAAPSMERAAAETGESAFIGTLVNIEKVRYLAKVVSTQDVRYDASLEPLRPAHCTSIGLIMLAHTSAYDPGRSTLKGYTSSTITDPVKIVQSLEAARRQGFAEVVDGHVEGASGVSAPIFGPEGAVVAALNIGAPTWRYQRSRTQLIHIVCREARTISTLFKSGAQDETSV